MANLATCLWFHVVVAPSHEPACQVVVVFGFASQFLKSTHLKPLSQVSMVACVVTPADASTLCASMSVTVGGLVSTTSTYRVFCSAAWPCLSAQLYWIVWMPSFLTSIGAAAADDSGFRSEPEMALL